MDLFIFAFNFGFLFLPNAVFATYLREIKVYPPLPIPSFHSNGLKVGYGSASGGYNPGINRPTYTDHFEAVKLAIGAAETPHAMSHTKFVPRYPIPVYGDTGAASFENLHPNKKRSNLLSVVTGHSPYGESSYGSPYESYEPSYDTYEPSYDTYESSYEPSYEEEESLPYEEQESLPYEEEYNTEPESSYQAEKPEQAEDSEPIREQNRRRRKRPVYRRPAYYTKPKRVVTGYVPEKEEEEKKQPEIGYESFTPDYKPSKYDRPIEYEKIDPVTGYIPEKKEEEKEVYYEQDHRPDQYEQDYRRQPTYQDNSQDVTGENPINDIRDTIDEVLNLDKLEAELAPNDSPLLKGKPPIGESRGPSAAPQKYQPSQIRIEEVDLMQPGTFELPNELQNNYQEPIYEETGQLPLNMDNQNAAETLISDSNQDQVRSQNDFITGQMPEASNQALYVEAPYGETAYIVDPSISAPQPAQQAPQDFEQFKTGQLPEQQSDNSILVEVPYGENAYVIDQSTQQASPEQGVAHVFDQITGEMPKMGDNQEGLIFEAPYGDNAFILETQGGGPQQPGQPIYEQISGTGQIPVAESQNNIIYEAPTGETAYIIEPSLQAVQSSHGPPPPFEQEITGQMPNLQNDQLIPLPKSLSYSSSENSMIQPHQMTLSDEKLFYGETMPQRSLHMVGESFLKQNANPKFGGILPSSLIASARSLAPQR